VPHEDDAPVAGARDAGTARGHRAGAELEQDCRLGRQPETEA
jgi:hypothetical protein